MNYILKVMNSLDRVKELTLMGRIGNIIQRKGKQDAKKKARCLQKK